MNEFLNLLLPWQKTSNDQISDVFVYIIGVSFLILLTYFGIRIFLRYRSIRSLTRKIHQFKRPAQPSILQELKEEFDRETKFAEAWQEFSDSLITRHRDENQEIVYKTEEASFFFSEDRLLGEYMNLRFWNSIPAILVGFGILGTFVGLVWGLIPFSDTDFQNTEDIKNAIEGLLSGVSTAFVTSVWGMVTSLLFNGVEKLTIGGLNSEISNLHRTLDNLFTLTVQEEIAFQQADELEQQTAALKSFSTDLANDIKSAMMEGRQELIQELHSATKEFSSTITDQLEPTFNNLNLAIDELRKQKEESSTEAIEKLIEQFQSSLSTSTVTQMEELAKTVGEASQSLKSLPDQIGEMITSIQEQINETRRLLSATSQEQTAQMNSMMEGMINSLQSVVDIAAKQTSEQLDQQMGKMKDVSDESIQMLQKTIADLQQSITETVTQQRDAIDKITSQTAQASTDATDHLSQLIEKITNRLSETVQDAEDSISKLLQQQSTQTEVFNDQISNSKETLESGQKMLAEMEASVSSVRQIIEKTQAFSELLTTGADLLESTGQQLMQASTVFNQENENYLTANRETIQQLQNLHGQSQQLLDNSTERFQTIDEGLQSIFSEIETGLNSYSVTARESINEYLSAFSEQLSLAAAALSGSVDALTDSVEEVTDLTERIQRRMR